MVYVSSDGSVSHNKGWSLSTIPDLLWAFVNGVTLFVQTLVNPALTARGSGYVSDRRAPGRGGPPGAPRRRMGGFGSMGGASPPPASAGG